MEEKVSKGGEMKEAEEDEGRKNADWPHKQ